MLAAGVRANLVKPFMAMYRAPRRIVADGLAGEPHRPLRRIPAGCPAATTLLALLTWGRNREVQVIAAEAVCREYIDDLTVWAARSMLSSMTALLMFRIWLRLAAALRRATASV